MIRLGNLIVNALLLLLGGLLLLRVFAAPPSVSFKVCFWGMVAVFAQRILSKTWPPFRLCCQRIKYRFIVFRELLVVGVLYGLANYFFCVLFISAVKDGTWIAAVEALNENPVFYPIPVFLSLLFLIFAVLIGIFIGTTYPNGNSFGYRTQSVLAHWFIIQARFNTKHETSFPSLLRGRRLWSYAEICQSLFGRRKVSLWTEAKWRAYLIKRWISKVFAEKPEKRPIAAFVIDENTKSNTDSEKNPPHDNGSDDDLPPPPEGPKVKPPAGAPKAKAPKTEKEVPPQPNVGRKKRKSAANGDEQTTLLRLMKEVQALEKKRRSYLFEVTPTPNRQPRPISTEIDLSPYTIYWSYLPLPLREASGHFLVAGTPGSGKTVQIRLLLQSVFANFGKGLNQRALIYDGKREYIPIIKGLDPKVPVHILNPFDARSVPWDIASDVTTHAAAYQVATILIPEEQSQQPFFADAARQLLFGVLIGLQKTRPGDWTLRDVLLITRNTARLSKILNANPEGNDIRSIFFEEPKTLAGILSTMMTKLAPLTIVAALWDSSSRRMKTKGVSLSSWLDGESVFVLGNHPRYSEALGKINATLLRLFSDLIVSEPDTKVPSTWLFLDELREGPKFEGLSSLLNQGRSKGVCMVIGFQDIDGVRSVYGDKLASEMTGQCRNKSILRTDSHATAKWAEEHFGNNLVIEYNEGRGSSRGGSNSFTSQGLQNSTTTGSNWGDNDSISSTHQMRPLILASEIQGFLPPSIETGFRGVHDVPSIGAFHTHISWKWIFKESLIEPEGVGCIERNVDEQTLRPWTEADAARLAISNVERAEEGGDNLDDYFGSKGKN